MATAKVSPRLLRRTPLIVRSLLIYALVGGVWCSAGLALQPAPVAPVQVAVYTPPVNAAPSPKQQQARRIVQGIPRRIVSERLGVDLPVETGTYDAKTGEWTLSDSAAYFAAITDAPNDFSGSTFIYGHNRTSVFGPLNAIRSGDVVEITTQNGHVFTYSYMHDASIAPNMTDILYEHPKTPQLVLMTCEGVLSATRRIMYFTLTGVVL